MVACEPHQGGLCARAAGTGQQQHWGLGAHGWAGSQGGGNCWSHLGALERKNKTTLRSARVLEIGSGVRTQGAWDLPTTTQGKEQGMGARETRHL